MTMRAIHGVAAMLAIAVPSAANAQSSSADSSFGVSIGLRLFVNKASGPGYAPTPVPGMPPTEASITSDNEVSLLPSLAIRYGRWVANGSYHMRTTYSAQVPEGGGVFDFRRKEWDAGIGYAVLPSLVVSAGWKTIDITVDQVGNDALSQKGSGPFVGLAVSAQLSDAWSVFGSVALGRPRFELDGVKTGDRGEYLASEVGLRYALRYASPALRNVALLAGYRTQSFRFDNVPYSFVGFGPSGTPSLQVGVHPVRQGIDGLTFGVTVSF